MPPIEKASDLVGANSAILSAAADGEISTGDAAALGSIVGRGLELSLRGLPPLSAPGQRPTIPIARKAEPGEAD